MMFVILSYDVNEKRVGKVGKTVRKYLWQVHRSVYQGYLTEKQYKRLKTDLKKCIIPSEDAVCFYTTDYATCLYTEKIGKTPETDTLTL